MILLGGDRTDDHRVMRRNLLLLVGISSGVLLDQCVKAWADDSLGTEEHPVLLTARPDDDGLTLAELAEREYGVDEDRLARLSDGGYRPLMRFDSGQRTRPTDPAFAAAGASVRRGLSYWVFHHGSLERPPRRLPRADEIASDSSQFMNSTVRDYLLDKLGAAMSQDDVDRLFEGLVYTVDYTRLLPSDLAVPGETYLLLDRVVVLIDGFAQLRYAENPGAAWGLLSGWNDGFRRAFFLGITVLALGVMAALLHRLRTDQALPAWALGLIFAGAVGNLIDRVRFNYVIDFVDFYVGTLHWPTFNLADMLIAAGAGLLVVEAAVRRGRSYLLGHADLAAESPGS